MWSDISNTMSGLRDHYLYMLVLEEVLGLELSNFSRQLKMKPGVDDNHQVIVELSIDLWFRGMEVEEEKDKSQNAIKSESSLGSYGFANETGSKHVAALEYSNSSIGNRQF